MSDSPDDDRTVIKPVTRLQPPPAAAPTPAAPDDHGNALPVGTYLGEFEITSMLGEGGFGIVYMAWDHSLERRVALKEYMPSALAARSGGTQVSVKSERHRDTFEAGLKSFVNEAKLLAQFDHASLVKVYRFWEANGTAYMIMPFYEGQTLKQALKDMNGPPDEAWLMGMLAPLTEALEVIHAEQCFHRDIAPDNVILLKGSGRPLLLDFGAARRVIGDMTQALTVILKPGYAPVEQYAEVPGMKQGGWTDLYALAASIHYAILGKTPPPAVGRLMSDNYVPLAQQVAGKYSDRFLKAIDQALIVKPEDRTQSVAELRAALGLGGVDFNPMVTQPVNLATHGVQAPARAPAPATPKAAATQRPSATPAAGPSRTGLVIGVGALALAGLGGTAFWLLTRSPETAPAPAAVVAEAGKPGTPAPPPGTRPGRGPGAASCARPGGCHASGRGRPLRCAARVRPHHRSANPRLRRRGRAHQAAVPHRQGPPRLHGQIGARRARLRAAAKHRRRVHATLPQQDGAQQPHQGGPDAEPAAIDLAHGRGWPGRHRPFPGDRLCTAAQFRRGRPEKRWRLRHVPQA